MSHVISRVDIHSNPPLDCQPVLSTPFITCCVGEPRTFKLSAPSVLRGLMGKFVLFGDFGCIINSPTCGVVYNSWCGGHSMVMCCLHSKHFLKFFVLV